MRNQFVIAVKEQDYVRRLADYVRDSPFSGLWQLTAFTHEEAFVQFLKSGYPVHGIAAQPCMLEAAAGILPEGVPVAALVAAPGQFPHYDELLQYQALPGLLQRMASLMAPASQGISGEQAVQVIAIYSASGGVGKTTLARQLVHTAAGSGQRVFYLNLERWNAVDTWLEAGAAQGDEGLSQLLYILQSHPGKAGEWLGRHSKRHALLRADYILPCSNQEDRMTLQSSDADAIVRAIAATGQYDLLVIDLDEGLNELHLAVMELSHHVIWLVTEDQAVQRKSQLAYQYGMQRFGERFRLLEPRLQLVVNRSDGRLYANRSIFKPAGAFLPDTAEKGKGTSAVLASPSYMAAVERLYRQLVKEEGGAPIADG
ncbi:AAA family ATPase [Paenibacillus sp. BK720]|uniref:AAA family ATPase n=1 Tax=Paenibacillus sp. BK720 TaxID=2587092 RepID=UPI00142435F4|nr:cellulose biosynthesis protein BcsQ [Paenibacillus sp. BK720]